MSLLHIKTKEDVAKLKAVLQKPIAILVYMEGCGPCNATRPEWAKIKPESIKNKELVVVDLNKDVLDPDLEKFIGQIDGFPTIKLIQNGKRSDYSGNRTEADFIKWINKTNGGGGGRRGGKSKKRSSKKTRARRHKRKIRH
jgi:thiol-disulfide isomerase/thioredoxin